MPEFLRHGGEMGRLIHAQEWRGTALGSLEAWPRTLQSMLATVLGSAEPMFMCWGPRFLSFFNDSYRPMLGARFSGVLGRPAAEQWANAWPDVEKVVRQALDGQSARQENLPFTLLRHGYEEPTWWTLTFIPFRDEAGAVAGIFCLPVETTQSVLLEHERGQEQRQQAFRIELSDALRDATNPEALMRGAAQRTGAYLQASCAGYAEVDEAGRWLQVLQDWTAAGFPGMAGGLALDDFGPALAEQLRAGQPVAVSDTASDALMQGCACPSPATRAFITVPLIRNARLAVVFFVLDAAPRRWTPNQMLLVTEVAGRTWTSLNRLRAELEVRQMNRTLQERTGELLLSQQALHQSQKLEVLGQLTGGVAHDFNNLLALISSSVELLRGNNLPPARSAHYLDLIFDTVGRAVKLTAQLLAFARQQPLSPEVFDVDTKVREVVDLVRPLMGSKVRITHQPCGRNACFAEADISQFETALVNLAVNARDAMEAGGQLTIAVSRASSAPAGPDQASRPGDFVAISVADTGCGIAADKLEVVFEPFYTTKEVGRGTGLGLSQVFGFAKQSGGEVQVKSKPGSGSIFTLYLPRAGQAPTPQPAPPRPEAHAGQNGLGVLVVEDNEMLGQMACDMLEALGHRPEWAGNAASALEILATGRSRFALVFSDVVMPGMNGIELGLLVRQRYPDLPVVLTSGYNTVMAEDGKHGFELIQKPYTLDAIVRLFRKVLGEQAAESSKPG